MRRVDRGRRRALLAILQAAASFVLLPSLAAGQPAPRPPSPPSLGNGGADASNIEIPWNDYQKWLESVRSAARQLAAQSGTEVPESTAQEFDEKARDTLESNGYRRPSPPRGLRIIQ